MFRAEVLLWTQARSSFDLPNGVSGCQKVADIVFGV